MIGLHSQSGPTVVHSKGVIFPPVGLHRFPVGVHRSKMWMNNKQLCHYCVILDVYGPLCMK